MLMGANTILALITFEYSCLIEQHCGTHSLAWIVFKTLTRSPFLWGLFITSLSMHLASVMHIKCNRG
jgi:hypothetical protein